MPEWINEVDGVFYVKTAREALAALDYIPEDAEIVVTDNSEQRKLMILLKGMGLR